MANLPLVDRSPAHITGQPALVSVQAGHLPCLVGLRLIDQRLTHQADDQAVALVEAHALLQLAQDLVLVLDVAAFRLSIGERVGWCDHSQGSWAAAKPRRCSHLPHVHP